MKFEFKKNTHNIGFEIRILLFFDCLYLYVSMADFKIGFKWKDNSVGLNKYPFTKLFQIDRFYEFYLFGNRFDFGIVFNPYKKNHNCN